jgi:uncharacterized protein
METASDPTITLGKTGLRVRRIGFGGIPIQRLDEEQAGRVIERAVEVGIGFFDSARAYTSSERRLGAVLSRHRQRVVIATKSFARTAVEWEKDLAISLRELRTDYIDIYQCHNIASESELTTILGENGVVPAMERARQAGKIRFIGISGHKPRIVKMALERYPFTTIQIPFNHIENESLKELVPFAKKAGVGTISMKPVGGGNIRETALNFRFILTNGIDVAIPGMDSIAQVEQNVAVLSGISTLSAAETARLSEERERLGTEFCRRCEYCMPCPQGIPVAFMHVLKNYYNLYDLKDWVMERLAVLPKSFKDCTGCGDCVRKCPYSLNSPETFRLTWERIRRDRNLD